ncbi:hypothetical protein F5887DRAFT_1190123 [Amanita rubescens]|nr:hypothetical protein F5887DRAFT_1190123 [Amanita rubescens]
MTYCTSCKWFSMRKDFGDERLVGIRSLRMPILHRVNRGVPIESGTGNELGDAPSWPAPIQDVLPAATMPASLSELLFHIRAGNPFHTFLLPFPLPFNNNYDPHAIATVEESKRVVGLTTAARFLPNIEGARYRSHRAGVPIKIEYTDTSVVLVHRLSSYNELSRERKKLVSTVTTAIDWVESCPKRESGISSAAITL